MFNNIPIFQMFSMLLVGVFIFFVFRIINTYIFPLKQDKQEYDKLLWQRIQIILWIVYALVFFTILFYENQLLTTVLVAVIIGLGWQYWSNVFSGILIKLNNDLRVGDSIETDFVSGKIKKINISQSILKNETGEIIVIPNNKLKQSVRKHQNQKSDNNAHVFIIKSDKLTYDDVYKLALNCPYLVANQNINIERVQEDKFQIKANLIDISFVDLAVKCFVNIG